MEKGENFMEFLCNSKYLIFPTNRAAQVEKLLFYHNSQLVLDLDVSLDYEKKECDLHYNMERFKGLTLEVKSESDTYFEIRQSDIVDSKELYQETNRPKVHFSTKYGWINDPNGLVYLDGTYHLFYQYNPIGCLWNNMHWGHATSADLVNWTEHEIALYPDEMGTMYSGCAIVDKKNLLGMKTGEQDTIVLFYTAAGNTSKLSEGKKFTQCLAYSTDGGKHFTKYENNPVIEHIVDENRDPKVIYHEASDSYIMVLYLSKNQYGIFKSANLVDWKFVQEVTIEGDTECPDFYPLALDGDETNIKWVFIGSSDKYLVGSFDGEKFVAETTTLSLHQGYQCYAAQSWYNIQDGRRIRIAWNRFEIPDMYFNQSMTIPCVMSLKTIQGTMRLCTYPVAEIEHLYAEKTSFDALKLHKEHIIDLKSQAYDISFDVEYQQELMLRVELFGMTLHVECVVLMSKVQK